MKVGSNIVVRDHEVAKLHLDIEKIQEDLTLPNPEYANMKRFGKGRFYKKVDSHICYLRKVSGSYIIPRYYFGEPSSAISNATISGRELSSRSSIKLRKYQEEFFVNNSDILRENTGILLEAACGSGKTVMSLWLAFLRNVQTMVLVPTYYLAKQWKNRIEECSDATTIILKSSDKGVPLDRDFTIVVMDLFSVRSLPSGLIENVGHVILDEAHRVGAGTYLPILDEIPAKFRTALTATFRRADGVHRILKYHFGEHIQMENRFPKPLVYGVRTGVKIRAVVSKNRPHDNFLNFLEEEGVKYHETKGVIQYSPSGTLRDKLEEKIKGGFLTKKAYHEIASCLSKGLEMSYPVVDSYLNEHCGRRKLAIRLIEECLSKGRTVLFLSKRKDTLKALHRVFAKYRPMLIVSETNERSDDAEEYLQKSCPLIFGVTQLAKEGLDIDRLDTLIIHMPMKDTEQAIGRISRLCEGKKIPTCLYLLDDSPITYAVYANARKFFKINAELKGERTLQTIRTVL